MNCLCYCVLRMSGGPPTFPGGRRPQLPISRTHAQPGHYETLEASPNYAAAAAAGKAGCRIVISMAQLRLIAQRGNGCAQYTWMGQAAAAAGAVMMSRRRRSDNLGARGSCWWGGCGGLLVRGVADAVAATERHQALAASHHQK